MSWGRLPLRAVLIILTHLSSSSFARQRPNIVVFIADDLGRMDVSFTEGNLRTPTPNIDRLAWDGIILNRHYSQAICTPTRAAFLTGKYPFHTGMQTGVIDAGEPFGLPLQFPTQADLFRTIGYQTWHVGKWHLGEYQRAYFPQNRGFDYSYGYTQGDTNWFNYTSSTDVPGEATGQSGREFRENGKIVFANITNNVYLPELLTDKAEQLIRNSDPSQPFYLYFATPVSHTGSEPASPVLQTMPEYQLRPPVLSFPETFPGRKRQLGLVQVLDESFKRVTEALVNKGVMNNTIVVFFSDNGAPIQGTAPVGTRRINYSFNWPLRQGKSTDFEGGVRTPAFIWSPLLKKRGRITTQLFHMTDWLPTLWEAAGGDPKALPAGADGFSHWESFQGACAFGPRRELVTNIDTTANTYGLVYEDDYGGLFKLVGGAVTGFLDWGLPPLVTANDDSWKSYSPVQVDCVFPEGAEVSPCVPAVADCLFDLVYDPCETNNIAANFQSVLKLMQRKISTYNATAMPAANKPFDPASSPNLWDGLWVPWLDPSGEFFDRVPLTYAPFSPSTAF